MNAVITPLPAPDPLAAPAGTRDRISESLFVGLVLKRPPLPQMALSDRMDLFKRLALYSFQAADAYLAQHALPMPKDGGPPAW